MTDPLQTLSIPADMLHPTDEALQSHTAQTTPTKDVGASNASLQDWKITYDTDEPLYVEINIPLPALRALPKHQSTTSKIACNSQTRPRAYTLQNFKSPFHRRGSSSDSSMSKTSAAEKEEWPRIRKEIKSREVASAMNIKSEYRRRGTIDALAVVPAVLVLSAELFTPEENGERRRGKEGKWEDGWI